MMRSVLYYSLSAGSGLVWGLVVWLVIFEGIPQALPGGVIVSPFVGLAIGAAAVKWNRWPWWARIAGSLVSLYAAATVFGFAVGVYDWQFSDMTNRIPSAVVIQTVLAYLWGLTFTGFLVVMWPAAYLNHWLISLTNPDRSEEQATR